MAFYARSEEARQIHSVHKLALVRISCSSLPFYFFFWILMFTLSCVWALVLYLCISDINVYLVSKLMYYMHMLQGALALEDALYRGLPIQQELDALNTYLEAIDKDSLLLLVLSNLPEETKHHGPDTLLELNQKASH